MRYLEITRRNEQQLSVNPNAVLYVRSPNERECVLVFAGGVEIRLPTPRADLVAQLEAAARPDAASAPANDRPKKAPKTEQASAEA